MACLLHTDEKQIRQWRKQKGCILKEINDRCSMKKRKRLREKVKRLCNTMLKVSLLIGSLHREHIRVTQQSIVSQGKEMIQDPDFKASRGWIDRFMHDWGLTIRRETTVGQHLPWDVCNKVFDFVWHCAEQGTLNILPPAAIANMDETAIRADMPEKKKIGATSVPLLTKGHEKERINVIAL